MIAAAVLACSGTPSARAVDWSRAAGDPGDIGDGTNWTGGSVPAGLDALINNGGIATTSASSPTFATLGLGTLPGSSGTIVQTGGTITSTGNMTMGAVSTGTGLYNISGGSLSVGFGVGTGEFFVGKQGNATLNLNGPGTVSVKSFLHVGGELSTTAGAGAGTLLMSAGTLNVIETALKGTIFIGDNAAGTMVISGGVINTRNMIVGRIPGGSGNVTQTGGSVNASINLVMFERAPDFVVNPANPDFWTMSAGSITVGNEMYIGAHGPSTFNLSGTGSITIGGALHLGASDPVGDPPEGFGTLNMNGGTINVTGANAHFVVGDGGGGTFNFSAGSITTKFYNTGQNHFALGLVNQSGGSANVEEFVVGEASLGANLYDLSGGSITVGFSGLGTGEMLLGSSNGAGTLKVRGTGSISVSGSAHLGAAASSSGTMNISGGTVTLGTDGAGTAVCLVGDNGVGALIVSSGALTTPLLTLGQNASALGTGTQTGGSVTVTSTMSIGETSVAANVYDISGGTLAVTGDIYVGANGSGTLKVSGTGSVSAASIQNQPAGAGTVNVSGGTLNLMAMNNNGLYTQSAGAASAGVVTGSGQMAVSGGSLTATSIAQGTLLLSSTGRVNITPNGGDAGTSRVTAVSVTGSSKLDLADNDLVVDYPAATPIAAIQAAITSAYAAGAWTGNGITSSSAAVAAPSAHKTALGYAEAIDLFTTFPATFSGQSIDNTSVLVRYTASGDANLDGSVDTVDFNFLASNFSGSGKRWTQGDFNYDTFVDTVDFSLLASNFSYSVPGSPLGSLVPEPASLGLFGLAAVSLLRRRRR